MNASDYIIDFLVEKGVKQVFLITGGAISFLIDKLHDRTDIDYICVAHEQAASMAADAVSRLEPNTMGVALATSGPGATNLLTGIGCSWFDSIPTFFITGQVNTYESKGDRKVRQVGFQEMDIVDIAKPITKYSYKISSPDELPSQLSKAWGIAISGRPGPVLLDIPMNVQREEISSNLPTKENLSPFSNLKTIDETQMTTSYKWISESVRPVILAGGGVRLSGAIKELQQFSELYNLPVCLSMNGIDAFPHDHPNFAGFIGVYGSRYGNFSITNSDLLISIGSRLDSRQTGTGYKLFARQAKKITVEIDKEELAGNIKADLPINCDAKSFLDSMLSIETGVSLSSAKTKWLDKVNQWKTKYPSCPNNLKNSKGSINPYHFFDSLSAELSDDDVIINDTGQNMLWAIQTIKLKSGMRMFTAGGMSPMGYSLPASMGAAFSRKNKRTLCIIGDGGMQINIQELQTIRRYNLPVKIFVINNNSLGLIRQFQDDYLDSRHEATSLSSGYSAPRFDDVAKSYCIKSIRITNSEDFDSAFSFMFKDNEPALCDVVVEPNSDVLRKAVHGHPIEDQFPYLDRKDLLSNLLIPYDPELYTI